MMYFTGIARDDGYQEALREARLVAEVKPARARPAEDACIERFRSIKKTTDVQSADLKYSLNIEQM